MLQTRSKEASRIKTCSRVVKMLRSAYVPLCVATLKLLSACAAEIALSVARHSIRS